MKSDRFINAFKLVKKERWLIMKHFKHFKKLLSLLLALALIITPVTPAFANLLPKEGTSLAGYTIILHTNDSHGRAVPNSGSGYMGFTAVSALKKSYEAAGAEVVLLDAGDTLHGLPFANLVKGESIVELMNLAGYDAMTPGNHDFNYGTETLLQLNDKMGFPLLSANITKKSTGRDLLEDHILIQRNGVTYGIFGLSTPETEYKTNPNNVAKISFGNPIDAATKEVAVLKEAGADVIIALAHLGVDKSSEFTTELVAEKVDGIDLIVDGHSHTVFEEGFNVGDTLIVSTGDYIRNIGVVVVDPSGNMQADLINAKEFTGTDTAIDELVATYSTEQEELLSEVIGYSAVYLDGVREHVRAGETNLGNLATDAFRYITGADVAITNGGGIRASIEIGDITKKEIVTVFPFGNYVVTKKVTGEALLKALEQGTSAYPEPLGAFLQVSGITFAVDTLKPAGSRVVNAKVNGKALDPKAEYLLATNDFIIAGGDGYTMLADFEVANEFGSMEDVLIEYLKETGEVKIQTEDRVKILLAGETVVEETVDPSENDDGTAQLEEETEEDEGIEVEEDYDIYVVKKGDYLRKIATLLYDKESEWKKIYEWNKELIMNPDRIYVGQELKVYAE
jgi:5'-nucleotidase